MHALRIRGAQRLARAARIPPRRYASALPGYPTPGSAFSPPPAPVSAPESSSANVNVPGQRSAGRHNISGTTMSQKTDTDALPESDIPVFTTLVDLRAWRDTAFREGKTVGFVPTMGALHQGHITLVRESLKENDLTVISIYVNPSQFAPHEDLATYPRTLASDVSLLSACSHTPSPSNPSSPTPPTRTPSAIFCPTTSELYPSGHSHSAQLGTYVLPAPSLASQMEGKSRPTFFRGVATVVTKLLNSVLPTRVYFGQKDIQQALLMKGVVRDLCASAKVRVIRTVREEGENMEGGARLALSSRNAYLSRAERRVAPTLRRALGAVEAAWYAGASRSDALAAGQAVVDQVVRQLEGEGKEGEKVEMKLDYMEMNDPRTFEVIPESLRTEVKDGPGKGPAVILSGALWVGRTRLIDNILLGDAGWVFE